MTPSAPPNPIVPDAISGSGAAMHAAAPVGVRGWLLVLCLMLTVVGPVISVWIVGREFDALAARFVTSRATQWATIVAIASTTCAVAVGIRAGLRLWTVKPHAVRVARTALLFGLAVDVLTTTITTVLRVGGPVDGSVFYDVLQNLVPSLLFFTLCLGYLNRSRRVEATYGID